VGDACAGAVSRPPAKHEFFRSDRVRVSDAILCRIVLPLIVAFPIVGRLALPDAQAGILAPAEKRLAIRDKPTTLLDPAV
jgi:hypothetical protein